MGLVSAADSDVYSLCGLGLGGLWMWLVQELTSNLDEAYRDRNAALQSQPNGSAIDYDIEDELLQVSSVSPFQLSEPRPPSGKSTPTSQLGTAPARGASHGSPKVASGGMKERSAVGKPKVPMSTAPAVSKFSISALTKLSDTGSSDDNSHRPDASPVKSRSRIAKESENRALNHTGWSPRVSHKGPGEADNRPVRSAATSSVPARGHGAAAAKSGVRSTRQG